MSAPGPFLVRVSRPPERDGGTGYVVSEKACETLGKVHGLCLELIGASGPAIEGGRARSLARKDTFQLPEQGGTIVLPNGELIEVKRVTWYELGATDAQLDAGQYDEVLARFNSREAKSL